MARLAFSVHKASGRRVAAAGGSRDRSLSARARRRRRARSHCLRAMIVRRGWSTLRGRCAVVGWRSRSCGRAGWTRWRILCRRRRRRGRCRRWWPFWLLRRRNICRRRTCWRLRCALLCGRRRKQAYGKEGESKDDQDVPVSELLTDSRPHRRLPAQFKGTGISAVRHLSKRDERSLTETSASLQGFELLQRASDAGKKARK